MAMQSPSSSSSISYQFKYQVFLSFRGSDTRYGFTGNLYKALTDKGIHTFIDDRELQRGDEIKPSLDNAIEESRIFIPVFSPNYAYSSFCLDELVHIIHCYKTKGRLVLPVFYGVDPTHIRHQTGSYGEALAKHAKRFHNNNTYNMERLQKWKIALAQAANLSGDHRHPGYEYKLTRKITLDQTPDSSSDHCSQGYEYDFIEKIVKYISNKINRVPLHVAKYPVGLQSQLQQVKSLLDNGSDDGVHMVGMYGIGGLGKSTLARAIYNFVADQFEGLCFLHDVRENSAQNNLKHLQEKLLFKTTGLEIKLDHVSEGISIIKERLCRKKILLILDDVDSIRQLDALAGGLDWFGRGSRVIITTRNKHLLSTHGIKSTHAVEGLYGTDGHELLRWMAFKSDKVPSGYEDILNRAVAYASGLPLVLEIVGSNLFGKSIEEWKYTLDGYDRIPNKEIQKILKVSYDALEEEEQSVFLDIACCSKGCGWREFEDMLRAHYGHCITHHLGVLVDKCLIYQSYGDMTLHDLIEDMGKAIVRQESPKEPGERSRLWCQDDIFHVLKENSGTSKIEMIYMNFPSMESVIDQKGKAFRKMTKLKTLIIEDGRFSKGLKYLPSSLRVLKWKGCLSESLSASFLNKFQNMKVLTLDECEHLTHIPDISGLSNLQKLTFNFCKNLITIDDSIGHLNKLELVSASCCKKLENFPPLWLVSLKNLELSLHPCVSGMLRFPKHNDKMYSNVTELCLRECNLSDEYLPIILKWFVNVKHLDLSENVGIKILPECLNECHLLRILNLDGCESLEEIRGIPPNLNYLSATECLSLSSSTRRMLLSQKVHEAGCTNIRFHNAKEGIPDWFEHQIRGHNTISFWFRKKIPSITSFLYFKGEDMIAGVHLFVNGYECPLESCEYLLCGSYSFAGLYTKHAYLFDLKLEEKIKCCGIKFESEMDKTLLKNEWIHVELRYRIIYDKIKILRSAQMGIHVLKEKSNTDEDVIFTNPYRHFDNKWIDGNGAFRDYSNTSLSQFEPPLKKQRLVEMGVSETESLQQQQHLALLSQQQQMALLPQQQRITVLSGMWNLVLNETKEKEQHDWIP
ncbi:putative TIR domain, P-loop containing nucleoside triphosphate hydrolase [Medicago truncatula]|uniref:Putative TIR domain, P-loop containing nucleoside triphosphate hydrolase n=1 Tax=Medicago truncatula TaxID=3880 RepID=A0A396HKF6_MEDTR|nr:putative TIR domain, P-loop containing nucleoside triphosphate hydrolase [Medicago truncatula]